MRRVFPNIFAGDPRAIAIAEAAAQSWNASSASTRSGRARQSCARQTRIGLGLTSVARMERRAIRDRRTSELRLAPHCFASCARIIQLVSSVQRFARARMSRSSITQPDPFGFDQPELFDAEAAPPVTYADPERVRARLWRIINEAKTAARLPWDARKLRLYRTIVPQMSLWLPDDEAARCASSSRLNWRGLKPRDSALEGRRTPSTAVIPVTTGIQRGPSVALVIPGVSYIGGMRPGSGTACCGGRSAGSRLSSG